MECTEGLITDIFVIFKKLFITFFIGARNEWGVTWVLLGGDIDIIPPRVVAGVGNNTVSVMRNDPPNQDQAFWNGTFMKFNCTNIVRDADVNLINFDTGQVFPWVHQGTSSETILGWNFTTNDSYADSYLELGLITLELMVLRVRQMHRYWFYVMMIVFQRIYICQFQWESYFC